MYTRAETAAGALRSFTTFVRCHTCDNHATFPERFNVQSILQGRRRLQEGYVYGIDINHECSNRASKKDDMDISNTAYSGRSPTNEVMTCAINLIVTHQLCCTNGLSCRPDTSTKSIHLKVLLVCCWPDIALMPTNRVGPLSSGRRKQNWFGQSNNSNPRTLLVADTFGRAHDKYYSQKYLIPGSSGCSSIVILCLQCKIALCQNRVFFGPDTATMYVQGCAHWDHNYAQGHNTILDTTIQYLLQKTRKTSGQSKRLRNTTH